MVYSYRADKIRRTIIGPVIGGYLAEPVSKYPSLFHEDTVWDHYPYLLPNLVVVVFLLTSCILGFLNLQEVHPQFRKRDDIGRAVSFGLSNLLKGRGWQDKSGYSSVSTREVGTELTQTSNDEENVLPDVPENKPQSAYTRQVMLQILSVSILGFLKIATLAMVPVFLATPSQPSESLESSELLRSIFGIRGGFGLNSTSISNVLLTQALASILSQIIAVPAIIARKGPLWSYKVMLWILLCLYFVMPFAVGLPTWLSLPVILVVLWVYALANGLGSTCSGIL